MAVPSGGDRFENANRTLVGMALGTKALGAELAFGGTGRIALAWVSFS